MLSYRCLVHCFYFYFSFLLFELCIIIFAILFCTFLSKRLDVCKYIITDKQNRISILSLNIIFHCVSLGYLLEVNN